MEFTKHVCKSNTPVFNASIFASIQADGLRKLDFDDQYLIRSLETILYPNTLVRILKSIVYKNTEYYKIQCCDYPSKKELFVHQQNISVGKEKKRTLPSLKEIQTKLESLKHTPYFWGGTLPYSIKNAYELFSTKDKLTPFEKKCFEFEGLDCSGLLYHVTNGYTPRNTSSLMNFGQVCKTLKPLDLILWPGHVVLMLDANHTIESREFDGLVTEPAEKRLFEIKTKRVWVEKIDSKTKNKMLYTTRRFL